MPAGAKWRGGSRRRRNPPQPGEPQPLPPLEDLVEKGRVLGLNFPVALNPALARGLGVMLKLDFQRAVLNRIPKITANPRGSWRDILFVADEYHAFATVGETEPSAQEAIREAILEAYIRFEAQA